MSCLIKANGSVLQNRKFQLPTSVITPFSRSQVTISANNNLSPHSQGSIVFLMSAVFQTILAMIKYDFDVPSYSLFQSDQLRFPVLEHLFPLSRSLISELPRVPLSLKEGTLVTS